MGLKKLILMVFAIMAISFSSKAQFYVGGNVALYFENVARNDIKSDEIVVGVLPEFGYIFSERFESSIGFNILYGWSKTDDSEEWSNPKIFGTYIAGQYNCIQKSNFTLGAMLKCMFNRNIVDDNYKYSVFGVELMPVFEYAVNDKFSIKTTFGGIGYGISKYDDEYIISDYKVNELVFDLLHTCSFGIKYKF